MAQLKFDARHGLTVGNGSVTVIDSSGKLVASFAEATVGTIPYQSASGVTSFLPSIATGNVLLSGGVGVAPSYGKVGLTTHVSGTLPVLNGGTGVTTSTGSGDNVLSTSSTIAGTWTFNGGTVTASTPMFNLSQTWNSAGVTFDSFRINITNTAAGEASSAFGVTVGTNALNVDRNCAIVQILGAPNIARDIKGAGGSRHVREYQDLTDDGRQGLLGSPGVSTHSFEWGFTWNAKWDTTTSSYIKDRSNAGDHAFMFRVSKKFNQEWWFSDGTSAGSAIAWANRITFDLPNSAYTFTGTLNTTNLNVTNSFTSGTTTTQNLVVNGDFTVNGTQTILNTTEVNVDDINITLGAVDTPTDTTANGGGITLKGTTDKTILWNQGTGDWDSNQSWNIALGKTYKINGASVLSQTALGSTVVQSALTSVGVISTGTWNADTIVVNKGGTGVTTLSGLVFGNGTSPMTAATSNQIVAAIDTTPVAKANNIVGGNAGYLLYQSGIDTTASLAAGTAGNILVSNGAAAPSWNTLLSVLGYTPVQQGGGTGQGTNKVYVGWYTANAKLGLQVDATDYASLWPIDVSGNAATTTKLATVRTINGVNFDGTASITVTANTPNTLTRGAFLTGTDFNGSAPTTWAVDASVANTNDKIVVRGADGSIYGTHISVDHASSARTTDTIFYSSTDNLVRKTDAASFRTSLDVPTRTGGNASGTWNININSSGVSTVPTAAQGTNTTQIASTAFVQTEIATSALAFVAYADRGTLRSMTPLDKQKAVIEGLGLFVFFSGSTEIDDDESCFATASGRWILSAIGQDVFDAWTQSIISDIITIKRDLSSGTAGGGTAFAAF